MIDTGYVSRKKVGLALGSGAVRGYALIPVIRRLEEEGIEVSAVSGSSIGAVVGAYFALNGDVDYLFDIISSLGKKGHLKLLDPIHPKKSLIRGKKLKKFLVDKFFGDKTFRDSKIPLFLCAVDTRLRKPVYLEDGKIIDAVMASISIPGIFPPYRSAGKQWIDGGVLDPVPVKPLLDSGLDKVIGINLMGNSRAEQGKDLGLVPLLLDSFYMMMEQLAIRPSNEHVFMLNPCFRPDPANMLSFYAWEGYYRIGEDLIEKSISDLLIWLDD